MDKNIDIKQFNINEVSIDIKKSLKKIFLKAAYNTHMYKDFLNDLKSNPKIFKIFIAYKKEKAIGVIVVETKLRKEINYYGYSPIHLKRFAVLPEFRSKGIGKCLLDEAKKFAFKKNKIKVIFGESNELGALSFYGREKALYSTKIIKNYSHRNSPDENLSFFKEFITNKKFKKYRYPTGHGILFVFCATNKEKIFFIKKGFIPK